jgi:hypothetical protein
MPRTRSKRSTGNAPSTGRLRIGDDWNAINIIALSQSNPLKSVAEFVENSIDANARSITITRGRHRGEAFLRVMDDGDGVPLREDGKPDFQYVATHICDSIKRHLKAGGAQGIQGEFGIGLLSFWTVGEQLTMTNSGSDGRTYQLQMQKGSPRYTIEVKRSLFPDSGTELTIQPLLPGIRQLSGDKIQWYLASELRDRIRKSGVRIKVVDRTARKEYIVEPRRFTGRLLHELPAISTPGGEVYTELYLAEPDPGHEVGLYRSGTRVLRSLTELDAFRGKPWDSGYLQGIVDAPFINLTPGTRTGVVQDAAFERFRAALQAIEAPLNRIIDEQRRAEEARASRKMLDTIRKAFREAMLTLPAEEYDWFDIEGLRRRQAGAGDSSAPAPDEQAPDDALDREAPAVDEGSQKQFFEYAGPLFSIRISPQSSVLPVGGSRNFRAIARDRSRIPVEHDVGFVWRVLEGGGVLANEHAEIATFTAPSEPGLTRIGVTARQRDVDCAAEALVTVTDTLLPEAKPSAERHQGLPNYTFRHAAGELWRSRYDSEHHVIVINNGHRDFVFASRNRALKLRYICRLFAKEMVQKNFPGYSPNELLERMIELSLYTEENLR